MKYKRCPTRPIRQIEASELTVEISEFRQQVADLIQDRVELVKRNKVLGLEAEQLLERFIRVTNELSAERAKIEFLTGRDGTASAARYGHRYFV